MSAVSGGAGGETIVTELPPPPPPISPVRNIVRNRRSGEQQVIIEHSPSPSEESDETESQVGEDEEEVPCPDRDPNGPSTFKEAIEGLFSSKTVQSTPHELILVKRYSHGKSFRQRLAYLLFRHHKTRLLIHLAGLIFNLLSCFLYIAEAIYIDELLSSSDEEIFIECFNHTITNTSNLNGLDLIMIPKDYVLWSLQLTLALVCLFGAFVAIYAHQETSHGSVVRHFLRHMTLSIVASLLIGVCFLITLLLPQCLYTLWIPSFLYCWPARLHFMYIVLQKSEASFFKSFRGFRTTAISLATFLICFMFSCLCFIHHFERLGNRIHLFDTYWFVVVTFSTVGYGDISPAHWTGKVIITIFIIAALLYLPPKVDKLWRSFTLHRKHYKQYNKTGGTRHIVLAVVSIKPLVLRDFLNEIYSEPSHMDTQCVILIEDEVVDSIKSILTHPVWSQRVIILRGVALRSADLARAKVRTADACFLLTPRNGPPKEADQHTVLSAWTIKQYAPKCKLYVHIRQPQSKLQLNIADQVICEDELTSSVLSLNSICPGLSTLAALLSHTFTYEGRGFNNEEYQWYEKCSPVEIYDVKLGESQYFHHFVGKNFLFTSVVAYRKFHVVLMGIRPAGRKDIIFNPGIPHLMQADDICYYISETNEVYSDFQVIQPTCVQSGLWRTSATLGLLAMYISGIDPAQMFHQSLECEDDKEGNDVKKNFPRITSIDKMPKRHSGQVDTRTSLTSQDSGGAEVVSPGHFKGTDSEDGLGAVVGLVTPEEEDLDEELAVEVTNWQHDIQLGLQLLKYHGEGEQPKQKPCVKLSVRNHPELHHSPRSQSLPTPTTPPPFDSHTHPSLGVIPEDGPEVVVVGRERTSNSPPPKIDRHHHHHRVHSQPSIFHLGFPKRHSENHPPALDHHRKSGTLKFHPPLIHHESGAVLSSASSDRISIKSEKSTHSIDDIVVLQLDDISEVEELEDLEEGVQHDVGGALEEDHTPYVSPTHSHDFQGMVPLINYVEGVVPTLPYCGCVPLMCHLTPVSRPLVEMIIDHTTTGDDVVSQWHHHSIIVYSDSVSDKLFHFLAPLRASYLPPSSLKPVVMLLGKMPDQHFLSVISQLPMVYFMIGTILSTSDLLRAGILESESLVIFSSSKQTTVEQGGEYLADAEHVTAIHKIAKLFPHVRITVDVKVRLNVRFVHTTPFEELALQKLRHMARKGDHLTYLFLPQVASSKAFSSSMLDTLLYQSCQKPYIIELFRQLVGCTQVKGSGFLWKVPVNNELSKLHTYVRVFQRLAASFSFISMALYRSAPFEPSHDTGKVKGYSPKELEDIRLYLIGELRSLGIKREVDEIHTPTNQQFLYVNPPPDFLVQDGDIILGMRPPIGNKVKCDDTTPTPPTTPFSPPATHQHVIELTRSFHQDTPPVEPCETPPTPRIGFAKRDPPLSSQVTLTQSELAALAETCDDVH